MYTRSKDRSPFPSNYGEHQTLTVTVFLTMHSMSGVLWNQPFPGVRLYPSYTHIQRCPLAMMHDGLDIEYTILLVKAEKKGSTYG